METTAHQLQTTLVELRGLLASNERCNASRKREMQGRAARLIMSLVDEAHPGPHGAH